MFSKNKNSRSKIIKITDFFLKIIGNKKIMIIGIIIPIFSFIFTFNNLWENIGTHIIYIFYKPNLIANSNFNELDDNGNPKNWDYSAADTTYIKYSNGFMNITNNSRVESYPIQLESNSMYHFSMYIQSYGYTQFKLQPIYGEQYFNIGNIEYGLEGSSKEVEHITSSLKKHMLENGIMKIEFKLRTYNLEKNALSDNTKAKIIVELNGIDENNKINLAFGRIELYKIDCPIDRLFESDCPQEFK